MIVSKDHGECPKCGEDLNGGSIWEYYFAHCGDEAEADRIAAQFGATRTYGRWNLATHVKFLDDAAADRWQCPECSHEWECRANPDNLHAIADRSGEASETRRGSTVGESGGALKAQSPTPSEESSHD